MPYNFRSKYNISFENHMKKPLTCSIINDMLSWAKTVIKTEYKPKYFLQSKQYMTVPLWVCNLWVCLNYSNCYKTQQKRELFFPDLYKNILVYTLSLLASWSIFYQSISLHCPSKKNYKNYKKNIHFCWAIHCKPGYPGISEWK